MNEFTNNIAPKHPVGKFAVGTQNAAMGNMGKLLPQTTTHVPQHVHHGSILLIIVPPKPISYTSNQNMA